MFLILKNFLNFYLNNLQKFPLTTKIIASAIIGGSGDICAQIIEQKGQLDKISFYRTFRMVGIGSFLITPPLHFYFNILESKLPGNTLLITLKKLSIDQLIVAPTNMAIFLTISSYFETRSWEKTKQKFFTNYIPTLKANYMIWPIANFINFQFMPLEQRVVFVAGVGFFWGIYFSFMVNRNIQ
jgi:protein Mpv17